MAGLPGNDCQWEMLDLSCNQDEDQVFGGLFQHLEECIPYLSGQEVTSINNDHLISCMGGGESAKHGSHTLNIRIV